MEYKIDDLVGGKIAGVIMRNTKIIFEAIKMTEEGEKRFEVVLYGITTTDSIESKQLSGELVKRIVIHENVDITEKEGYITREVNEETDIYIGEDRISFTRERAFARRFQPKWGIEQ